MLERDSQGLNCTSAPSYREAGLLYPLSEHFVATPVKWGLITRVQESQSPLGIMGAETADALNA